MIQDWSCGSIEEEDESVTESETCLRRQLAAANERAGRLEKALNKLTTVVNGVTAPHRHGAPISNKHLDRLCEVQLECERILGGA